MTALRNVLRGADDPASWYVGCRGHGLLPGYGRWFQRMKQEAEG